MNILVVDCHRVGSHLARELDLMGHDVSVLAQSAQDLDRLNDFMDYTFSGMQFTGSLVDIDNLKCAGIESMDAVACVSPDENTNLMVAQIARDIFKLPKVICRLADPETKDVYTNHFGLQVVCPTSLTVQTTVEALMGDECFATATIGCSTASFIVTPLDADDLGKSVGEVSGTEERFLFGVLRSTGLLEFASVAKKPLAAGDQLVWAELID